MTAPTMASKGFNFLTRWRNEHAKLSYECEDCDLVFCLLDKTPICPNCGSRDLTHMVIVYKEDDPVLEGMFSEKDIRAGD